MNDHTPAEQTLPFEMGGALRAFYREMEARLAQSGLSLVVERGPGPEFGGFYVEEGRARVVLRDDLPPDAAEHTLAHELVHGLQRLEGWPRASAAPTLGDDSPAEEVAAVLQALVHCAAAELRIAPLGLSAEWEQSERQRNVRYLLRAPHAGSDQRGTPAWAYWTLLYAYLSVLHPQARVRTLLGNIGRALPEAAKVGAEAAAVVQHTGYATREQALDTLRSVHDLLALGDNIVIEQVQDEDPGAESE